MMRPVSVMMVLVTALMGVIAFMPFFAGNQIFTILFVFILFADVIFVFGVARNYMSAREIESRTPQESLHMSDSRVTTILQRLSMEYEFPLRLLVIRDHDDLYYTGRVHTTSTGVQMKEAVFLPR